MPQERWERLGHPSPRFVPILIRAHLILNIINIHRDLCLRTCWVRIAGGGAAPSPLHPTTRFYFLTALFFTYSHSWVRIAGGGFDRSLCYLVYCLFSKTLLLWVHLIWNIINIHRDLCVRTSCLVRIAGGGAAPSPLHPPTRFYFLTAPFVTYSHSWVRIAPHPLLFF